MSEDDRLYGVSAPAKKILGIYAHETKPPVSLVSLTKESASMVKSFFNTAHEQILFTPIPISVHVLWIMDVNCQIHLALEEMVDVTNGYEILGVLPRAVSVRPPRGSYHKLGHPTLLPKGEVDARIAGEIIFDPEQDPAGERKWCLTNESGRYGLRSGQLYEHLQAACRMFESFELYFATYFIQPQDD